MLSSSILSVSLLVAGVFAAPTTTAQPKPTIVFAPKRFIGCRNSQAPGQPDNGVAYNLTIRRGCVNPPYAFDSYVTVPRVYPENTTCFLNLYSQPKCKGTVTVNEVPRFGTCNTQGNVSGVSAKLTCASS